MPSPEAQAAFLELVRRLESEKDFDLAAFLSDRPGIEPELRRLHALWGKLSSGELGDPAHDSVLQRLRREHGEDIDPGICLEAESGPTSPRPENEPWPEDESLRGLLSAKAPKARYEVRGEVARGGMGLIYRVWDDQFRRTLAMKVILGSGATDPGVGPSKLDRNRLNRFLEEAQITGQLDHPGIVPVHELGLDPRGRVFFTMRLVRGRDLKAIFDLVREGQESWTVTRALGVMLKVCEAMAFAHEKGVVHRDLKPANIMVGRFGEAYVMDWGLAKVLGHRDAHDVRLRPEAGVSLTRVTTDRRERAGQKSDSQVETVDGDIIGTPSYMAPEQASGLLDQVGPRSDVYSVGAMLYHLLSGRMPYVPAEGGISPYAILGLLSHGPPAALAELAPRVPPELVATCEKAMAREPADRYASMMEMAEDLRAYLENRVVRAHRTGAVAEFRKWVRRNTGTAAALGGLFLVVVGGAIAFAWQQRERVATVRAEQEETRKARDRALEKEAEARWRGYVANLIAAEVKLRTNDVPEAKRRLEACDEEFRDWLWRHLARKQDTSLAVLEHGESEQVECVAFSSDGSRIATGCSDHAVRLWDAGSAQLVWSRTGHDGSVQAVAFTPDGARIASGSSDGTVRLWGRDSGDVQHILRGHEAVVTSVAFSSDGALLASGGKDDTIRVWEVATGALKLTLGAEGHSVTSVAFEPAGARIASASNDGTARIWNLASGEVELLLRGHDAGVSSVAFRPDGARLVTASLDTTLRVWDAKSGASLAMLRGHADPVSSAVFAPDGMRIGSGSLDKTLRLWDAETGRVLAVLYGHDQAVRSIALSGVGLELASASADGTARIWSADTGDAQLALTGLGEPVSAVALSHDGLRVAAASRSSGTIAVWDALSGAELVTIPGRDDGLNCLAFSPDGTWLVGGQEQESNLRRWDSRSGVERLPPLSGHEASVSAVAVHPDGERIASASTDETLRLWDARTAQQIAVLEGHTSPVTCLAYAPDGNRLATGSIDGEVRVWDASSGATVLELRGHLDAIRSVAFSPDGSRIVSGSSDRALRTWNSQSGEPLSILRGHTGAVVSVVFSPDGRRMISGSSDKTLQVWEPGFGESLGALRSHELGVTAVAISPDGARVVSASFDGTVRVWETAAPRARYQARLAAELVERLFIEHPLMGDVVAALEGDPGLKAELRGHALRIASGHGNDPSRLLRQSWQVVRSTPHGAIEYELAVRRAEAAARLSPEDAEILRCLGAARYRTGDLVEAVDALSRARRLLAGRAERGFPFELVFLALAQHGLGKRDEATQALEEAQAWARANEQAQEDPDVAPILLEAESAVRSR